MRLFGSLVLLIFALTLSCGRQESKLSISDPSHHQVRSATIHRSLQTMLEQKYPNDKNKLWASTTLQLADDWVIQSPEDMWGASADEVDAKLDCSLLNPRCDWTFRRLSCNSDRDCSGPLDSCEAFTPTISRLGEEAKSLCVGRADRVLSRLYDVMVSAEQELDMVSLAMPDGRFHTTLMHALAVLSQKAEVPRVRLLFSGAKPALPNFVNPTDKVLADVVDELKDLGARTDRLALNLAWLSPGKLSWNHAKIIVADGERAITGGHNLWDKTYLKETPLFDLSMEYRGPAAAASRDFVNTLWSHVDDLSSYPSSLGRMPEFLTQPQSAGQASAISIGRLGVLGANPSDDALRTMIDSAEHSLLVDQMDLFNQVISPLTRTFVYDQLIDAAVRGVKIKVVQSNNYPLVGGYGSIDGDKAYEALVRDVAARLKSEKKYSESKANADACRSIEYASFRFSAGIDKWSHGVVRTIGTHTKLMIADDVAFYIGSHNLYPANLQEYGLIVTDPEASAQLKSQYWDKLWAQSQPSAYSCPL